MKWIKRSLIIILVLIVLIFAGGYFWLRSSRPDYSGKISLPGLHQPVEIHFDDYGIPHIYASDKHDLYMAFGYVHAQERLFQMEMLRRAGSGRLAEIIGRPVLKVDRLFRTLGLPEYARKSAALFEQQKGSPIYEDVSAYLAGVNHFIHYGKTPPEYSIIGIPKTDFTIEDIFSISGAMSFSFSQAQKTDPVMHHINSKYGTRYLEDIALWHDSTESSIPSCNPLQKAALKKTGKVSSEDAAHVFSHLATSMEDIRTLLPFCPLEGSNSWVISGIKAENDKVIFCNDTHIGYMLPQTWYEAHLNAPGFELYGHFLGGVPFALVGRNKELSWGLTMLHNDDQDFYLEKINPQNNLEVQFKDQWESMRIVKEIIKVKGEADTTIEVRFTRHGPVVNDVFDGLDSSQPISMSWTYTALENHTVEAFYGFNNAKDIASFENNLPLIHAPGLSLNYGDQEGNIAWWGCASLIKRPAHVNPWTLLDGGSGNDEPLGYYSFDQNPKCINPERGYIYSANDWPQPVDSNWYPGYYKPQYRADRIRELLESSDSWTIEKMKSVMKDVSNPGEAAMMKELYDIISHHPEFEKNRKKELYDPLFEWDGSYLAESASPTFFNKMLYHFLSMTCEDELGRENFDLFLTSHQMQRGAKKLLSMEDSPWWDNVSTPEKEKRSEIVYRAFEKSIAELTDQYGENPKIWTWRKACTLRLKHPLGEVPLLRPFFSLSERSVSGGNETIKQSGFTLNGTGEYQVYFGSQMRIITDFAQPDSGINITPSGQSGHLMSPHYDDQAEIYREGGFRLQVMNEKQIRTFEKLTLVP